MTRFVSNLLFPAFITGFILPFTSQAQRVPVLPQIDAPHNYYYRELFIPQLTSGPSSADWSDAGKSLIFSMQGSLWKQQIGSEMALQLTDGDGYDYQPDVSPDGKQVLFVRYNGVSIELMVLDLVKNQIFPLTANKAVNLEPRWSPDGQSVAFVSTLNTGHFLLYRARIENNVLKDMDCLTPDRKSAVKRYYYSSFDHAINPAWSPDGKEVIYVSNNEIGYGTGDLVSFSFESRKVRLIHHEETSWRAKPDVSPDGSRIIFSSYQGRNYHQLWMMPVSGGNPFPLTYGEYDNLSPRWSPDGKGIVFTSNRDGNTSLWIVNALDGKQQRIGQKELKFIKPHQLIKIQTQDEKRKVIPARVSILDSHGKFCAAADAWIHGDDSNYPAQQKFENHYFHNSGVADVYVPNEKLLISVSHGPEFEITKLNVDATKLITQPIIITINKFSYPKDFGLWQCGDLHVHMNYGGNYLNNPLRLQQQAKAENLHYVFNLIVNKEQRIPDVTYFSKEPDKVSDAETMILHAQEFHTSFWGHLGLLNLKDHLIIPDYAGYPKTAAESLFPDNLVVARSARQQQGVVGYVHPFEKSEIFPDQSVDLHNELPVNAALGLIDYYELIGFADHKASEFVWYKLLNCGLRLPAGAGTDAMANYSSLRGPVGMNRVYVKESGPLNQNNFIAKLKDGNSFVTNGPILGFTLENKQAGDSLIIGVQSQTLNYKAFLRSNVPLDYFEVIWNGEVIEKHTLIDSKRFADVTGKVRVKGPGWMLLRAGSSVAHVDLPDIYPYASTNPIYIQTENAPVVRSKLAGAYFVKWVERLEKAVQSFSSYRNKEEQAEILSGLSKAREFYLDIVEHFNAN